MLFRKDIGFLRAIAVTAVVLYHFAIPGFSGGFAGVDVFFVISGFLMTGLIVDKLHFGSFSLLGFYAARARRIIPALLVLGLALMVFGFFYLPLDDYREYIRTLKSALLFTSNVTFSHTGDYFAAPLRENWLLHTWSLSVEWQFYLLYPLLLLALNRVFGPGRLFWSVLGLCLLSLAISIGMTPRDPTAAFYQLPSRAWEMLAGGLIYLRPLRLAPPGKRLLAISGLIVIAAGVFLFDSSDPWPGYLALVPVLGTLMVIGAGQPLWLSERAWMQYLGQISYSVYLWHWPLVVLLYLCGLLEDWRYAVAGIASALVAGALSYHWVEKRAKRLRSHPRTLVRYIVTLLIAIGLASIVASLVKQHPDLRSAFNIPVQPTYVSQYYQRQCDENPFEAVECRLGEGEVTAIMLGDSHAEVVGTAVQIANPQAGVSWSRGGCPVLGEFEMRDKKHADVCRAFNQDKFEKLKTQYPGVPVVLLSRASLYTDDNPFNNYYVTSAGGIEQQASHGESYIAEYARTVCEIARYHPVYLVKPVPEMPFSVYKGVALKRSIFGRSDDMGIPLSSYEPRNRLPLAAIERAAQQCGVKVLDPVPYMCPEGRCLASRGTEVLYSDDNHLADPGNKILSPLFAPIFHQAP
jgi:peptidoglycan/LPS O-acetylase OafA/YrhL